MTAPDETRTSDATEPATQPGDESERGYSAESHYVEVVEEREESLQQPTSTMPMETHTTIQEPIWSRTASRVTRRRETKRAKSAGRKAELMKELGVKEWHDRKGNRHFLLTGRGKYDAAKMAELEKL